MKVSFTGNYLYTYKDATTRNRAFEEMKKAREDLLMSDFDVFEIDKNRILLLNGQDYKNYQQTINFNKTVNIKGFSFNYQNILALADKAVNVDLRRINFIPKYNKPE